MPIGEVNVRRHCDTTVYTVAISTPTTLNDPLDIGFYLVPIEGPPAENVQPFMLHEIPEGEE